MFDLVRPWIRNTVGLLAVTQLLTAILVVVGAVVVIPGASTGILDLSRSADALFGTFLQTSAIVVLPATFVMGLSFPAASALVAGRDAEVGGRAGLLLASNTVGAIVGTFLVPFVVIPLIGSPNALGAIAIVNAALAVALALWGGLGHRLTRRVHRRRRERRRRRHRDRPRRRRRRSSIRRSPGSSATAGP